MSGWQIALLVLAGLLLLLMIPFGVTVRIEQGDIRLWLRVAFFRFRLNKRDKPRKERKARKAKEPPPEEKPEKPSTDWSGYVQGAEDVTELLGLISKMLRRVLRSFKISKLRLNVTVATPDAAGTALLYGRLNVATALVLPVLYQYLRIRNDRIRYLVDFQKDKPEYALYLRVVTTPAAILGLAVHGIFAVLGYWWPRRKKQQAK